MTNKESEALELADQLERMSLSTRWDKKAAAELRRLHQENIVLLEQWNNVITHSTHQVARIAALEKTTTAPDGYALVSVDMLKHWGKYDEVKSACQYPVTAKPKQKPLTIPDWPESESLADLPYAQKTAGNWSAEDTYVWQRLQVCERNKMILRNYAKQLRELLESQLSQPEPEPVAYGVLDEDGNIDWTCDYPFSNEPGWPDSVPLYTAPPQREWIGLTKEEYEAMAEKCVTNCYFDTLKYARAIEARLHDKNS